MNGITKLRAAAEQLVGMPVRGTSRVLEMEMFEIGPDVEWIPPRGAARMLSRFGLHLQCPWRIVQHQVIVVASGDVAADGDQASPWAFRSSRLADFLARDASRTVSAVRVSDAGDLTLEFSDGSLLEVFVDRSTAIESYRLLDVTAHDLVVSGSGVDS